MRDLDKISTVIKVGTLYDPAAMEQALGITPRKVTSDISQAKTLAACHLS